MTTNTLNQMLSKLEESELKELNFTLNALEFKEIVKNTIKDILEDSYGFSRKEQKEKETFGIGLLRSKEVCEKFDVSLCTLWRWEKAGYLTPKRLGKKRLYKAEDIEAVINGGVIVD